MTDDELQLKVRETLAVVLRRQLDQIKPEHSLIDDLGAESIDFLDLEFSIEDNFSINAAGDELWRGSVDFAGPDWSQNGKLNERAVAVLKSSQPEFPWERFENGIELGHLPRLLTVHRVTENIRRLLQARSGVKGRDD